MAVASLSFFSYSPSSLLSCVHQISLSVKREISPTSSSSSFWPCQQCCWQQTGGQSYRPTERESGLPTWLAFSSNSFSFLLFSFFCYYNVYGKHKHSGHHSTTFIYHQDLLFMGSFSFFFAFDHSFKKDRRETTT